MQLFVTQTKIKKQTELGQLGRRGANVLSHAMLEIVDGKENAQILLLLMGAMTVVL